MATNTVRIGEVTLTRVGYADVVVPAEAVGLTADEVRGVGWAEPDWADDGQIRAGAAAWIIESGDARIVVDPLLAADDILRNDTDAATHQEAFASLLDDAGFSRASITHAVATHIESIGMFGWRNADGNWEPFFPNAPVLIAQRELDEFDAGGHVAVSEFGAQVLRALETVQPVLGNDVPITDEVTLEHAGGHTVGHLVVRVTSGGETAVMVGHLAISPVHFVTGENPIEHPDPETAERVLQKLRGEDVLLVGPLWPAPGAGRWDGERIAAVQAS